MSEPLQKPGRSKQDYGTPPEFLAAVKARLGIEQFDCDLAASPENAVCSRYFTEKENGLQQGWMAGMGWNWLNPPFGNIAPWVKLAEVKARCFQVQTAVLIPAAVGANYWRDHVHLRCHVLFLNGRIQFVGAKDLYPKDCALLLYSPYAPKAYDVWTWKAQRRPFGCERGDPVARITTGAR
jgi:phage N-6-adenine-methyltransferase